MTDNESMRTKSCNDDDNKDGNDGDSNDFDHDHENSETIKFKMSTKRVTLKTRILFEVMT